MPEEAAVTQALDLLFLCPVIPTTARDGDLQVAGPPTCHMPYCHAVAVSTCLDHQVNLALLGALR